MKKRERDPIGFFRITRESLKMVLSVAPAYFLGQQVAAILHGTSWGFYVLASQWFFDAIARAAGGGEKLSTVLLTFALLAFSSIASQVLNGIHNFTYGVLHARLMGAARLKIHEKSSRIPAIAFEDAAKLDDINKAEKGAENLFMFLLTLASMSMAYLPYYVFMALYLYRVNPILPLAILAAFVPSIASHFVNTKILSKLEDKAAPIRRALDFHEQAVSGRAYLKETRLLGAFGYFRDKYLETLRMLNRETFRAKGKAELIGFSLNVLTLAAYGGVIVLLIVLMLRGEISPGSFAAVYYSMGMVFDLMRELVIQHLGNLSTNYGTIRNLIRFLDMPEAAGEDGLMDRSKGVAVEGITFRYPQAEKDALSDVSLQIRAGETVAIVGENGSGKTTLNKLLTGLYTPAAGRVLIGGLDTKTAAPKCLYDSITGVFQKYQRYALTLKQNVQIADFESGAPAEPPLRASGVDFERADTFPEGVDTTLSREFGGVDLSGGQWQRIAIARGFYREHELIVLDEPTAAIDPIEESRIYRQFAEIAKDKTAVIVTHRMGSARIADRIIVMEKGRVAQTGTHEDLMAEGGLYKQMYDAQAEWYVDMF